MNILPVLMTMRQPKLTSTFVPTLFAVLLAGVIAMIGVNGNSLAFATKDDTTINGNKADPPGSDAACTGNPHDFSQPTANPHDFSEGETTGNPHECFEFVIPESPIGSIAMALSALGSLGGFLVLKSRIA